MGLLLVYFAFSIAFSFICSILEAVLLSVTPSYTTQQMQAGTTTGKLLAEYKDDIDRPLSAILTLNTLAHTVGAIGVGIEAGKVFGGQNLSLGPIALSVESIIAGLMTLAILILSEIIPKTIGANNWKALSPISVKTIRFLTIVLAPLIWVSQLITKSLKNDKDKAVLTRADFAAMTSVGETSGALQKNESLIINNLLTFQEKTVHDIMTPRTVAFMVQEDTDLESYMAMPNAQTFTRIPVYSQDKDHITGYVLKNEVFEMLAKDKNVPIKDLAREVPFVYEGLTLPNLFNRLTKDRKHLFIVTDEYGGVVGLVTMEDLVEELLGREIMDESDKVEDLQLHARRKWEGRKMEEN